MNLTASFDLKDLVRTIPDYPKPGIMFRDITTLLGHANGFRACVEQLARPFLDRRVQAVAGIEARGFILGGAVADRLRCGFVPIRKKGKLPGKAIGQDYELEYGIDVIEIHEDAIKSGEPVLLVDDLIATGGTAVAAVKLLRKLNADVVGAAFVMGAVDGGERRPPIDGREPAGIAMGEDVDRCAAFLLGMRADQPEAMLADLTVGLDVLVADFGGTGEGGSNPSVARLVAHGLLHLIERPTEIDRGRTRGGKDRASPLQRLVGRVAAERERHPVSGGRPDQGRPPHLHGRDGARRVLQGAQGRGREHMWQFGLVDDLDRPAVVIEPDGAVRLAVDVHSQSPSKEISV